MIGSVHSYMNLEAAEMTDRLLRALECPHLRALGHPTGRILLNRDPYPFDFDAVAAVAARRNVYLEINASPERLDLTASLIRAAKARGAKFVISTDAHHPKHLANMRYGVLMARRGWLEAGDILNTLPVKQFARTISGKKGTPPNFSKASSGANTRRCPLFQPVQKLSMKLISSTELIRTPIFHVTSDRALDPDGFEIKRAIVQHGGSAVMMPIDDRRRVLLVKQYRLPARRYMWELPAGRVDEGETPLQAAKRELVEEAGLRAKKWAKLAEFFPSPGFLAEKMTIYTARDLTQGDAKPMEDERIETKWYTAREIDTADSVGQDHRREDDDRVPTLAALPWRKVNPGGKQTWRPAPGRDGLPASCHR